MCPLDHLLSHRYSRTLEASRGHVLGDSPQYSGPYCKVGGPSPGQAGLCEGIWGSVCSELLLLTPSSAPSPSTACCSCLFHLTMGISCTHKPKLGHRTPYPWADPPNPDIPPP